MAAFSAISGDMNEFVTFSAAEIVFRQGYPADYAYIIKEGEVEVYYVENDKSETHIAYLGEGEMFGELGLIDDAPRSASVRAKTDIVLQILDL